MRRGFVIFAVAAGLLVLAPVTESARAELRFNSQTSLLAPDPFLQRKKMTAPPKPRVAGKLEPGLLALVAKIETHFGAKAVISSGCRTPEHNRAVGGAPHSFHLSCAAADISIPGVGTGAIRDFVMALPERGGVGTYCATPIVHVDTGPRRQWHWGCNRFASRRADPFALPGD